MHVAHAENIAVWQRHTCKEEIALFKRKAERAMRGWTDAGIRVIIAMGTGAALVALVTLANVYLIPGGLLDALGGWRFLAESAALLCGVCALALDIGLRLPARAGRRFVYTTLALTAVTWGVCISQASSAKDWARAWQAIPWLASAGMAALVWLALYSALAGLLAGLRAANTSATQVALTPLWLTPLWGASIGAVYGLLYALIFTPDPPGFHRYGLDRSPWDGLRASMQIGLLYGVILGLTLTLALRLALALRPVCTGPIERTLSGSPTTTAEA